MRRGSQVDRQVRHGREGDADAGEDDGAPRPPGTDVLRERWFACSSALGWSSPAEWPHPTVDRVCAAVCARLAGRDGPAGIEKALARWAGARAGAGVGLAETMSDLAALHTAVSGWDRSEAAEVTSSPPAVVGPHGEGCDGQGRGAEVTVRPPRPASSARGLDGARLLRAVALAWTDVACGDLAETAALDPLSGLASLRYLRTRLAEVYRGARARGERVPDTHALVAVTLIVHGWTRVAPLSLAGEAAGVVFDAGESLAVVGRRTVVVLAPREGLAERAKVLRRLLARRLPEAVGVAAPPSVRVVALPATHGGACALLERMRDAEPG